MHNTKLIRSSVGGRSFVPLKDKFIAPTADSSALIGINLRKAHQML